MEFVLKSAILENLKTRRVGPLYSAMRTASSQHSIESTRVVQRGRKRKWKNRCKREGEREGGGRGSGSNYYPKASVELAESIFSTDLFHIY